ncbi:MAG: MlaD family protein [Halioglobus sp.]
MSNTSNSVSIGAFVLGAVVIAVAGILFVSGSGIGQDRTTVVMVFDGSVKGLSIGAPVALRGVQIGQISDIDLIFDADTIDIIMFVEAEIREENIKRRGDSEGDFIEEMIARGLRAQLNTQSILTGLLYVQLDFHPNSELVLAHTQSPYTQIPTIPTDLQRLSREFESINFSQVADDLTSLSHGLKMFVLNEDFQQMPKDLNRTLAAVETMSSRLSEQLKNAGPKFGALMDKASVTLDAANAEIPKLSSSARETLVNLNKALDSFNSAVDEIDHLVGDDSSTRYELNNALRELALAGRAMQLLAKTLEEQPEAILRGKRQETP